MQKRVGEGAGGKRGRETAERGFKGGGGGVRTAQRRERTERVSGLRCVRLGSDTVLKNGRILFLVLS